MPFRRRYFQPGALGHATPVHLERLPGMRQQFVVDVPLFWSRSPRPMARRLTPLRLLPSQASTQSERAHAAATRPHTHRKRSKAPLASEALIFASKKESAHNKVSAISVNA
jgi:hypothetical protein